MSAIVLALSVALMAQDPAPQDPARQDPVRPVTVEGVTVEGRQQSARERAIPFVREIIAPARRSEPARWAEPVCVQVLNLEGEAARYMADRVATVASDVGLRVEEGGCEPNILIALTDDSDRMAHDLVDARRRQFVLGSAGTDRGREALAAFQASDAPVRWWHVSLPVDIYTGRATVRLPGQPPFSFPPQGITKPSDLGEYGQVVAGSRLLNHSQNNLQQVIIIVDVARAEGTGLIELTDYVAMVALAQIDPDAEIGGYDTILNLFTDGAVHPPYMTDWDWAFLTGLYTDEVLSSRGVGTIADGMAREVVTPAAPSEPE
ncbi:hypothetical protein [Brevundimonas sp. A19_0]|uniref:hypothetical protein n=1 Tax=Brevundimonas sp. A19_0 TaxID=2821087 RepID=UPI001ADA2E00|nr:hypothetical protein [Brevundimonas sp. A19_0]MBO9502458.1 hypothetical protein [Brevundimonas sp. A19_0]